MGDNKMRITKEQLSQIIREELEMVLSEEFIPGGESSKYGQITVDEMIQGIAEEHGVDPEQIRSEFEMGVEEEMEHAEEELIAQEIALDHLVEDPEYYTKLEGANLEETKKKRNIKCNNPKGFSQRAHCAGRKKEKKKKSGN